MMGMRVRRQGMALWRWLLVMDRPVAPKTDEELDAEMHQNFRWNFTFNVLDGAFFWLGLSFISHATILPLFVSKISPNPLLIGLLAMIGQSSWYLPQLFTAGWIEQLPRKKPVVANLGFITERLPLIFLPWLLETTYKPINMAISGSMSSVWWIGVLLAIATIILKPITNAVTLASGGEGGTFAPALKVGALFGFVFGMLLSLVFPTTPVGLYAVVCAGGVLAGTFRAPLTGGILLFEVSGNYELLLPLLFSSVVSVYIIRRLRVQTFNSIEDHDDLGATSSST